MNLIFIFLLFACIFLMGYLFMRRIDLFITSNHDKMRKASDPESPHSAFSIKWPLTKRK